MGWTAFLPGNNWSIFKIFSLLGTNQATEFNEPLEPLLSIHAEEEDQVFVYLYNVKISIWETQLYSYCVRRQSSKDLLPNTSALHDVVHFILFYSSRAKTTTDNDQPPFLWHGQCKLFTKVTSVCILMYKLLLYPESSCLVWSFKTNAALKLRPFPIYHPLISSLHLVPLSGIVRSFDWL